MIHILEPVVHGGLYNSLMPALLVTIDHTNCQSTEVTGNDMVGTLFLPHLAVHLVKAMPVTLPHLAVHPVRDVLVTLPHKVDQ